MILDVQPEVQPDPPRQRSRRTKAIALVLIALLILGGFGARAWWYSHQADVRDGTTLVNADGMAARYGINITLVAVSAAGGLIDFRYQVVDPDKANAVIHDLDLYPKIVVEKTGETLVMRTLPHMHGKTLELGGNYFFLLPNAHNAIKPGSLLTLVIGDARIEHVVAQS
jgi:hypothetical protein